ncbi:IclR family transcriptional regulator [Gordonia soli]|uniref:Putative IclR family transcriptional regulator n=1 Tax=Gordonia soli NBRC 108243 TaxID=1223545 RepID=M0QGU6_9ACTN|nr:IclR family transcriptional regulator [Gordonia soli]GAC67664.1 putative IclR family transcriptional regulator [Gordonia soli NBRC 108243]
MGVPAEAEGQSNREVVGAVLKACSLLEHFGTDRPFWTLNELTAASGMNKTTVHRLMATLIHAGWVNRNDDGGYRIAMRAFEVGSAALVRLDIRSAAQPYMVDLANTFGDTAYLMVPSEQGAVCIDKLEGRNPLVVAGISIGSVMPYHAAAGPTVMLAHSEEIRRRWLADVLPSFTDRTITDTARLATHLEEIRAAGYSISNADYLAGVAAVAAPIFDRAGAVVASISIGGRVEAFDGEALDEKVDRVRSAAASISRIVQSIPR